MYQRLCGLADAAHATSSKLHASILQLQRIESENMIDARPQVVTQSTTNTDVTYPIL